MGNEFQVLGVALAIIGVMVILARPFYGLLLFTALLYTRPEESIQALAAMHFTLAVAVVTIISMWFRMFMRKESFIHTPFLAMLTAFGLTAIASSLVDDNIANALQDISRLVILVLLIVNLVREKEQYRQFISVILLLTTYLAVYTMYRYFTGGGLVEQLRNNDVAHAVTRAEGTGIFSDPNDLATTLVAGLALVLSRFPLSKNLMKPIYGLLAVILVWSIFLCNSRGGLLALMLVIFGFFFMSMKNKKMAMIIGVTAALGMLLLAGGHMANFDSKEASANSRFHFWTTGFDDLVISPALGVGYGGFMKTNDGLTAHNTFVLCYAETGLIGYFFFVGALYYGFRRPPKPVLASADNAEPAAPGSPPPTTKEQDEYNRELLGARLALVGYMAASFWLSHTYTPIMYVMMPLPILVQLCWSHQANPYKDLSPKKDWRNIAYVALGSIVLIEIIADHYK